MPASAPLQVTVEIHLRSGPAAGQRRFRLSHALEVPPLLRFWRELPLSGEGRGEVRFALPGGPSFQVEAVLRFDPENPQQGSEAELVELRPEALLALSTYIEQRTTP